MELIDRYVYAVTERLPEDTREDVSRELHANIEDMLPENPTECDVRQVLEKLGNPKKLANEYSQTKKYLIGPALYDKYFSVLKLVVANVAIVFAFIAFLDGVFSTSTDGISFESSIEIFVNILIAAIQGIIQGALWVTLVFAILERTGVNEGEVPLAKKEWAIDDLPQVPISKKKKISRRETVFSMFMTIFFTSLLYLRPQFIGLYTKGDNGLTQVTPLFVTERLHYYIFIIFILAIIQLSIFTWKFISMHWSFPLAIANAVFNAALCILIIVMLSDKSLFNPKLLPNIAYYTKTSLIQITSIWLWGIRIFAVSFISISIWESVAAFIKCKK